MNAGGPFMRFQSVEPAPGFGAKLRELRDLKGWSQDRLADEMNLHRSQVSDYERGRLRPGHNVVTKLDALLEADGSLLAEATLKARLFAAELEMERLRAEVARLTAAWPVAS